MKNVNVISNYDLGVFELVGPNNEIVNSSYTFFEHDCKRKFKIDLKKHYQKLDIEEGDLELILEYINDNEIFNEFEIVGFRYNIQKRKYVKDFIEYEGNKIRVLREIK